MEHAVQHAVATIRERYWEPLSLDDLARSAMVSKFHFLRVFTRVTGVTPGRFLTAVRLQEAKRMLLSTPLTVADVSSRVGYSSTGSFTRRFTASVGLSPTQYRRLSLDPGTTAPELAGSDEELLQGRRQPTEPRATGALRGTLHATGTALSTVFVGAYDGAILEGSPVRWSNAPATGRFTLADVPAGTWYVHAVAHRARPHRAVGPDPDVLTATVGPVAVTSGTGALVDITLAPLDWSRPPILAAAMDIDQLLPLAA